MSCVLCILDIFFSNIICWQRSLCDNTLNVQAGYPLWTCRVLWKDRGGEIFHKTMFHLLDIVQSTNQTNLTSLDLTTFVHADPGDAGKWGNPGDDQRRWQHHICRDIHKDILFFKRRHWRGAKYLRKQKLNIRNNTVHSFGRKTDNSLFSDALFSETECELQKNLHKKIKLCPELMWCFDKDISYTNTCDKDALYINNVNIVIIQF